MRTRWPRRWPPVCWKRWLRSRRVVLGLPTGRTPLAFYRELRERTSLAWSGVRTFNLDEFVGLDGRHPGSYRAFMQAELFDHVNILPANIGMLNGRAPDLKAECRRYDEAIAAAGGIDCRFSASAPTATLVSTSRPTGCARTPTSRTWSRKAARPTRNCSVATGPPCRNARCRWGWRTILGARHIVLMATGARKANTVFDMVEGLITPRLPASFLQVHPRVTVMLDAAAAIRLKPDTTG